VGAGRRGAAGRPAPPATRPRDRRPDDAEIRRELRHQTLTARARLPSGAAEPRRARRPGRSRRRRAAGRARRDPRRQRHRPHAVPWGGGHGSWSAVGYDCSGSVSFALAGAGLLTPLASLLAGWGARAGALI
jgi:hypothetical protein